MNKFSAGGFYKIGCLLGNLVQAFNFVGKPGGTFPELTPRFIVATVKTIGEECRKIDLIQSAKCAERFVDEITEDAIPAAEVRIKLDCLQKLIFSEIDSELFMWIPGHRADWYSKPASSIVGAECCTRFPSIEREVEEAAKCYSAGRYTAAGFHLTRATEAGVQALARAISFAPPHNQWTLVFDKIERERQMPPANRPAHWKKHGKFLTEISADLKLVARVWRNDIMHLVATYGEEEAKELFEVIPKFLRDLAKKMDEKGKLY